MAQCDAANVAAYIICHCNDNKLPINNPRLQKILYFTQAEFLVEKGSACFSNDIEVWSTGPVVPDVYRMYCKFGSAHLYASEKERTCCKYISTENIKIIKAVINECNKFSTQYLIELSKHQLPLPFIYYSFCGHNKVVSPVSISEFFKNK